MSALPSYIPPRNADFIAWLQNFSVLATASPSTYGLLAADATTIATQYATIAAAYALISSSSTKTAATVSAYNTDKINALAIVRPYAQTISLNAGVSSSNKIAIGVNPRTSVPLPITTPTTWPIVSVVSASTAGLIAATRDNVASPSVKAKPYGAIGCQIHSKASTTPITDPAQLPYIGTVTKAPFTIPLPGTAGMLVYTAARWITRKGLQGPWSPIVAYYSVQP